MIFLGGLSCCGLRELASVQLVYQPPGSKWTPQMALAQVLVSSNVWCPPVEYVNPKVTRQRTIVGPPRYQQAGAHWIFSDAHEATTDGKPLFYGKRLAKYILKNKLGTVIATKQSPNPTYVFNLEQYTSKNNFERLGRNVHHQITCYVWTLDHQALAKWASENIPNPWFKGMKLDALAYDVWLRNLRSFWSGNISEKTLMEHKMKDGDTTAAPAKAVEVPKPEPKPVEDVTVAVKELAMARPVRAPNPWAQAAEIRAVVR